MNYKKLTLLYIDAIHRMCPLIYCLKRHVMWVLCNILTLKLDLSLQKNGPLLLLYSVDMICMHTYAHMQLFKNGDIGFLKFFIVVYCSKLNAVKNEQVEK